MKYTMNDLAMELKKEHAIRIFREKTGPDKIVIDSFHQLYNDYEEHQKEWPNCSTCAMIKQFTKKYPYKSKIVYAGTIARGQS